jgi:Domain of unknown function (DUF4412)
MTLRAATATALLALALPAVADFEGIADIRMTGEDRGGRMEGKGKLYLSPSGWRFELDMTSPSLADAHKGVKAPQTQEYRVVTFGKAATPTKAWMLNEKAKTFTVIEDTADASQRDDAQGWKIEKLGQETIAGFPCTNVKARREGRTETWEACLAKDFTAGEWLKKSIKSEKEWWSVAAEKAGVSGYPVRLVERAAGGAEKHRFEIVKVERTKVPASTFEVPPDYKEGSMMDVMVQTPEQKRQLEELHRQATEAMKKMTPEQRKHLEDMMRQRGAGQGGQGQPAEGGGKKE